MLFHVALPPKQQRFVAEYIVDLNASAAAKRAGYKGTAHALEVQGSRLLRKAEVARQIAEASTKRSERTEITADVVLRELLCLARVDIGQAFNDRGELKALKDIPEEVRRAIAGIEVDELFEGHGDERRQIGYTRKVKFWDKNRSLELLGKHLRLFIDRVEHSGKLSLEELVAGKVGTQA